VDRRDPDMTDDRQTTEAVGEYVRGVRLRQEGQLEAALEAQQRALALRPDLADAHYEIGVIGLERRDVGAAVEAFSRAVTCDPESAEARYGLACAYRRAGQFPAAVGACAEAVALKPGFAAAWEEQAVVYGLMQRYDLSIPAFRQALAIEPGNARVRAALGQACLMVGDRVGARAELLALEEIDDNLASLLRTLLERDPRG
jgi:tetratricopeptide (TPR) repeat protein